MSQFESFTDAVSHRGPDGRGTCYFTGGTALNHDRQESYRLALGHRRLSILDLTEAGSQPMRSADGNYFITYNGEVYNYVELREELKGLGYQFVSDCDTEVILAAYQEWGSDCFRRFNGMWSLVILDVRKRILLLSRDRIGIKPLYYYLVGKTLLIASEIKQFFSQPGLVPRSINQGVCLSYLATGYENPPETFFRDIMAFPPGHFAEVRMDEPSVDPVSFWFPEEISAETPAGSSADLQQRLRETFFQAVKLRLRSDVPVGGCLSGGLDSSSIFVAMKLQAAEQHFSAFSSCFEDPDIDERPFMKLVVDSTASIHHQVFPDDAMLVEDLDHFLWHHDEPVGSVSMFAQYKVMETAREHKIPVLLDGQGGDELFSGYWPAYLLMLNNLKRRAQFAGIGCHLAGACLPGGNFDLIRNIWSHYFEFRKRARRDLPFTIRPALLETLSLPRWHQEALSLEPAAYRLAEIRRVHLPRLLKWEDRNSMAHSIESRVPFLDVNLIETVLSISPQANMHAGWNKYLFRQMMDGYLPRGICWRRDKKGFETPQARWMIEGALHQHLLDWCDRSDHPVSEMIETPMAAIRDALTNQVFDAVPMFRLYCLDHWLSTF